MHSRTIEKYLKLRPHSIYKKYIDGTNGGLYRNGTRMELPKDTNYLGGTIMYGLNQEQGVYDLIEINLMNNEIREGNLFIGMHHDETTDECLMTLLMNAVGVVRFVDINTNIEDPLKSIWPEVTIAEYMTRLNAPCA